MSLLSQFKTKVSKREHFRKKIDRIDECKSMKQEHPQDFLEFCEVFTGHERYHTKFSGMVDVFIRRNPYNGGQLVVYIRKSDGTIDNVSVMDCIKGKSRDPLQVAARVSIQPQIDEYRRKHLLEACPLCGDRDSMQVDHHSEEMPFAKLYSDFMETTTLPIPTSFDNTKSHMKCFQISDSVFEQTWIQYHKENAIFRMLCGKCNQSQPKYKK